MGEVGEGKGIEGAVLTELDVYRNSCLRVRSGFGVGFGCEKGLIYA